MPNMKTALKKSLLYLKKLFCRKTLETKSQLEKLLDVNPAVIYRCETSGNYKKTFISNNIQAKMGYTPQEIINDPDFFVKNLHPNNRERVLFNRKDLFHKGVHREEYRFRHKDGSYRWLADELKLIRGSDGPPWKSWEP